MATKKYVSLEKLGLYNEKIKGVISAGDTKALTDAKAYANSLAENYDAAGSAATAEANAKAYADGKDTLIAEAKKAGTDAAAAAGVADGKAVAAQNAADAAQADVDNLATYVGTIPNGEDGNPIAASVVAYVDKKTEGIATDAALGQLQSDLDTVEGEVATIKGNYLKDTDKSELQGNIDTLSQTHATDKAALEASIKTITDDYLKAVDKKALQDQITENANAIELLTEGVDAEKVDGVKDLIAYVEEHGTEVTGMKEDIADNAAAIEGVAGRMTTAEGKITAVEGAVATKAEKTYVDEQIEALQGVDTGLGNRITALEGKFGGADGSVEDMIADAKAEAIATAGTNADTKDEAVLTAAKKYADDEDAEIEATVTALTETVGTKAAQSDLTALAGRVTTAEGEIDTLQTEMDAVEALADAADKAAKANAQAIALKAAQADLEAVSGRVTTLENWHKDFVECSQEDINGLFD